MPVPGRLTKGQFGFSMPVNAPLFPRPPYLYKGAVLMLFEYLTDAASTAALLPEQVTIDDQPKAGLVFAHYPDSSLGPYDEVVQFVECSFGGRALRYALALYVTTDIAMAAGREMGGYPKKIAKIDIKIDGNSYQASMERPAGRPIASGSLTAGSPSESNVTTTLDYLTLRLIPSPQKDAPPTVCELLRTSWGVQSGTFLAAEGSCAFGPLSAADPLASVPVVQLLGCQILKTDLTVAANNGPQSDAI